MKSVKMVIQTLPDSVIAQIRSSSAIESVTQCINELVLNSLDAKSTSISVGVYLPTFQIQVVDNGKGISRSNLESVGGRYMTTKCHSLEDLKKNLKYYGFKGEALANISNVSQRVRITTKEQNCDEAFVKIFENNQTRIESTNTRPCHGTTVTVEGFLNNLPVRQQCVKSGELENVKRSLESLIIFHPRVSFVLKSGSGGKLILSSRKCPDMTSSFKTVHPEIDENRFDLLKASKNKTTVEGLIHKDFHENKRLQYVYVNKRPISCPRIQALINAFFQKNANFNKDEKKKNPIFILHIKCPYSDIDINLEPAKTVVFFKKFEMVKGCIEKLLITFMGEENVRPVMPKSRPKQLASEFGVSQMWGVVKGVGIKRQSEDFEEVVSNKSAKIVVDTPFFEEPKMPSRQTKTALPIEIKKKTTSDYAQIDTSLFTNFPENEQKGKNVIMDMFIKSTQVYTPERASEVWENPPRGDELTSPENNKAVQTSPNGMVAVGVQTEQCLVSGLPRKPLTRFISDYDFDFSKVEAVSGPNFHMPDANCEQTRKLFDFADNCRSNFTFSGDRDQPFSRLPLQKTPHFLKIFQTKDIVQNRNLFVDTSSFFHCAKSRNDSMTENFNRVQMSCHKRNNMKSLMDQSCVSKYFATKNGNDFMTKVEMSFSGRDKARNLLDESSVSKYFSSKTPNMGASEDLFCYSAQESSRDEDRNRSFEKRFTEDIATFPEDSWEKDFRTPVVTKKKDFTFEVTERFDFVPKGLSPILKDYGTVDSMSPDSRNKLRNALVQSYEDELLLIKWQHCIDNKDPKKFFEEMYLEKSKLIEGSIPSISNRKGLENMSFTRSLFNNLEIIGQVDCKFIATLDKTKKLILLFDQHAVHERVRLEDLSKGYKTASTKLDQTITIFFRHDDLKLLKLQKASWVNLGLVLDFFTNGLTISEVPLCLYNKSKKGVDIVTLTQDLINEIVESLKSNNGILVNTPRVIQNIVNSEACRGAVKFGDLLSNTECSVHLKKLAECSLPFQCAHGRPTLTPLLSLDKFHDLVVTKPRLFNLLKY